MKTRFATGLVSLTALAISACGSPSSNGKGAAVSAAGSGNTTIANGSGGTATVPMGTGSAGTPPSTTGSAGTATTPPGTTPSTGGTATIPTSSGSGGSTGVVTGATGGTTTAPSGTGGTATTTCDDSAVASAKIPCQPSADPCNLHSGYDGDAYCILPPPAGKGVQIHFGPSNYTDMAEVSKYLMQPGEEFNAYGLATIPGGGAHWYNYVQIRMRPGSHHLINTLVSGVDSTPDGYVSGSIGCPGTPVASFPGTQNLIRNMPPGGVQAPENVGLGNQLADNTRLCVNHHAYNFDTSGAKLREIWINVWYVDEAQVTQKASSVSITAGPYAGIPPHTQKVLTATSTITGSGRIIDMFGHRHAATDRFAVWKNDELVYDSWHWDESVSFDYDSVTTNPAPNPSAKTDGATSGILPVVAGDKIKIECDVNNTTDNTLTFKNELYTGEMCILFGSSVGTAIH